MRPALEDLLGAGAILASLAVELTPEAKAAFEATQRQLDYLVTGSVSGQELVERGLDGDVEMAAQLDVSPAVPILRDGAFGAADASHTS